MTATLTFAVHSSHNSHKCGVWASHLHPNLISSHLISSHLTSPHLTCASRTDALNRSTSSEAPWLITPPLGALITLAHAAVPTVEYARKKACRSCKIPGECQAGLCGKIDTVYAYFELEKHSSPANINIERQAENSEMMSRNDMRWKRQLER